MEENNSKMAKAKKILENYDHPSNSVKFLEHMLDKTHIVDNLGKQTKKLGSAMKWFSGVVIVYSLIHYFTLNSIHSDFLEYTKP